MNPGKKEEVKQSESSGAVKFIDAKTGTQVSLQNSEVKEVTKDEFKAAVGKKQWDIVTLQAKEF